MGLFDQTTRKLAGGDDTPRYLKPERLAGHYEIFEGYGEEAAVSARRLARSARIGLQAALQREALIMGAVGLTLGVALGVAVTLRNRRS